MLGIDGVRVNLGAVLDQRLVQIGDGALVFEGDDTAIANQLKAEEVAVHLHRNAGHLLRSDVVLRHQLSNLLFELRGGEPLLIGGGFNASFVLHELVQHVRFVEGTDQLELIAGALDDRPGHLGVGQVDLVGVTQQALDGIDDVNPHAVTARDDVGDLKLVTVDLVIAVRGDHQACRNFAGAALDKIDVALDVRGGRFGVGHALHESVNRLQSLGLVEGDRQRTRVDRRFEEVGVDVRPISFAAAVGIANQHGGRLTDVCVLLTQQVAQGLLDDADVFGLDPLVGADHVLDGEHRLWQRHFTLICHEGFGHFLDDGP